jgi:hypothetical protein
MKRLRQSTIVWLRRPLDPTVPIVARRFAIRLLILSLFAVLPLPHSWGFLPMFVALTGFNTLSCLFMALMLREKLGTYALNHYDEALLMAALCLIGRLFI